MRRLTPDIDADLHRRMRIQCAEQGLIMADEIRRFLDQRFPPKSD